MYPAVSGVPSLSPFNPGRARLPGMPDERYVVLVPVPRVVRTAARVRAPAGTLRGVQDALQPALGAGCPAAHKTTFDTSHLGSRRVHSRLGGGRRFGRGLGEPTPRLGRDVSCTPGSFKLWSLPGVSAGVAPLLWH